EGGRLGVAESREGALAEAESLARRWHGAAGDRLRVCFAPRFVPSCSGPLLRAASELAELFGAQVHTHAAETIVERETVLRTTGMEEIAYLDSVGISGNPAALALRAWVDQHAPGRLGAGARDRGRGASARIGKRDRLDRGRQTGGPPGDGPARAARDARRRGSRVAARVRRVPERRARRVRRRARPGAGPRIGDR